MPDSTSYYAEEHPGVTGFAVIRGASILCAVPVQLGSYHFTREAAQAVVDRVKATHALRTKD